MLLCTDRQEWVLEKVEVLGAWRGDLDVRSRAGLGLMVPNLAQQTEAQGAAFRIFPVARLKISNPLHHHAVALLFFDCNLFHCWKQPTLLHIRLKILRSGRMSRKDGLIANRRSICLHEVSKTARGMCQIEIGLEGDGDDLDLDLGRNGGNVIAILWGSHCWTMSRVSILCYIAL